MHCYEVQTDLAKSMCKNKNSVFHSIASAIRLTNSVWYGKYQNILNREFADSFLKTYFS